MIFMTSRLEVTLNAIVKLDITRHKKDNSIATNNHGELYIQLKLLYKTHQPHELCPMPPLEMRYSVSIPESGVHIML